MEGAVAEGKLLINPSIAPWDGTSVNSSQPILNAIR